MLEQSDAQPDSAMEPPGNVAHPAIRDVRRKVAGRLLPYLFLTYLVAFLDRVNIAYTAPEMARQLGFSSQVLGWGMGIFFWGYFLLEIPGTILIERWSARRWIAIMMTAWGLIAMSLSQVETASGFYWLRFFLGAAEAGYFPGLVIYLTHWFGERDRARALSAMMLSLPTAFIIGGPVSGYLLRLHWLHMAGWRWLFFMEGWPAVVLGIISYFWLTDWPAQARWLSAAERTELTQSLQGEFARRRVVAGAGAALRQPLVWRMVLIYFLAVMAAYGFGLWLPSMLKLLGHYSATQRGWWGALPYVVSLLSLLYVGWSSDRSGERRWHTAMPLFLGAIGLAIGSLVPAHNRAVLLTGFALVGIAAYSFMPGFWALSSRYLGGMGAAVAVGLINSLGNLGGFTGPYLIGVIEGRTHSFAAAMAVLMCGLILAGLLILTLPEQLPARSPSAPEAAHS